MPFPAIWKTRLTLPTAMLSACLIIGDAHAQTDQPDALETLQMDSNLADSTAKLLIQRLATQLDDDRFTTRQQAQKHLNDLGLPAITEVEAVAKNGSLESATRAVNILLNWSEAKPLDLRLAALQALSRLPNHPRESALANQLLSNFRQRVAKETLRKLGARFTPNLIANGLNITNVIIGPNWKGTNNDLKHLAALPYLTILSFHGAPLDDLALKSLPKLPNLRRLEIYSTNDITPAAIKQFEQKAPHVQVERRKGAFLGVKCNNPLQQTIATVTPNGAAAKAGIQRQDQITEFNGEKVANFEELTKKIGEHFAGDTATLTIVRRNKTLKLKVTFDDWAKTGTAEQQLQQRQQFPLGRQGIQIRLQPPVPIPPR